MSSTTIHIPSPLLEVVDARARAEGLSRNRFILRALQRAVEQDQAWSEGFLSELSKPLSLQDASAVDEMLRDIARHRSHKPPPSL